MPQAVEDRYIFNFFYKPIISGDLYSDSDLHLTARDHRTELLFLELFWKQTQNNESWRFEHTKVSSSDKTEMIFFSILIRHDLLFIFPVAFSFCLRIPLLCYCNNLSLNFFKMIL